MLALPAVAMTSMVLVVLMVTSIVDARSLPPLTVKRVMAEFKDIASDGLTLDQPFNSSSAECGVRLSPIRSNLLEWHFSFTGVEGSAYEGGVYHGRIRLDPDYPRKAPAISVLTPSGRWQPGADICLSATAHHEETWDPNWNLRTLVLSLRGFMVTQANEVGAVRCSREDIAAMAQASRGFTCSACGVHHHHLLGTDCTDLAAAKCLTSSTSTSVGNRMPAKKSVRTVVRSRSRHPVARFLRKTVQLVRKLAPLFLLIYLQRHHLMLNLAS